MNTRLFHLHVAMPFSTTDDFGEWEDMLDHALALYDQHKANGAKLYVEWLEARRGKPLPAFTLAGTNCVITVKELY